MIIAFEYFDGSFVPILMNMVLFIRQVLWVPLKKQYFRAEKKTFLMFAAMLLLQPIWSMACALVSFSLRLLGASFMGHPLLLLFLT